MLLYLYKNKKEMIKMEKIYDAMNMLSGAINYLYEEKEGIEDYNEIEEAVQTIYNFIEQYKIKNEKISLVPTIMFEDIQTMMNASYSDFIFTQEVQNDSYVSLSLDEDKVAEITELLEETREKDKIVYERLMNELALVNYFRAIGYKDMILIYISW